MLIKKNNNLLIINYNSKKQIKICLKDKNNIYFDKESNSINISTIKPSIILNKAISAINKLIYSFEDYFVKKVKFKGKGFRLKIKKQKKAIKFLFGHSHINMLFIQNMKLKKCGKYKFTLKNTILKNLNSIAKKICSVKPINVYTNRGIRIGRQFIYKRKGKKGSYI